MAITRLFDPRIGRWARSSVACVSLSVSLLVLHMMTVPVIGAAEKEGPAPRLNVLFILVDDLRPALGCYNDKQARSPAIDQLATRGMSFQRAYSQVAYSTSSRISIMTGIRPDVQSLKDSSKPKNELFPEAQSLPQLFKAAGYEAIGMGRVYMNAEDDADSWSAPVWQPTGAWGGRGYFSPENIALLATPESKSGRALAYELGTNTEAVYPDQAIANHAIAELQRLQARPFFMTIGFMSPHLPFSVPKEYWDMHQDTVLQTTTKWPIGMPEVAGHSSSELRHYLGIPEMGPIESELSRTLIRGYYAGVSFIDRQIGRVIHELDRLALSQNTIVVLCSDHGYKLGDYGAWTKFTSHEIDLHTPLIMMGPGVPANTATDSLVELVDIVPTLSTMCGLTTPVTSEGLSLIPLFNDPGSAWKDAVYSLTPRGTVTGYSMRTNRWRYTEWVTGDLSAGSHQVMSKELYDHQTQTIVTRNLADLPESRDLMKLLGQQLRCGWKHVRPNKGK